MLAFKADMGSNKNNYPTVINTEEAISFIGYMHIQKCKMAGPLNTAHMVTHTVGINGQNILCRMSQVRPTLRKWMTKLCLIVFLF
jgi:hypothetical protein